MKFQWFSCCLIFLLIVRSSFWFVRLLFLQIVRSSFWFVCTNFVRKGLVRKFLTMCGLRILQSYINLWRIIIDLFVTYFYCKSSKSSFSIAFASYLIYFVCPQIFQLVRTLVVQIVIKLSDGILLIFLLPNISINCKIIVLIRSLIISANCKIVVLIRLYKFC